MMPRLIKMVWNYFIILIPWKFFYTDNTFSRYHIQANSSFKVQQWSRCICLSYLMTIFLCFILFLRERDRVWWGGRGQRGRHNTKQAPGSQRSAQNPTRAWNPGTGRSWPEPKLNAQLTEPPRCPFMTIFDTRSYVHIIFLKSFWGTDLITLIFSTSILSSF